MDHRNATWLGLFAVLALCGGLLSCKVDRKGSYDVQFTSSRIEASDELKKMSGIFLDSLNGKQTYREVVINRVRDSHYVLTFRAFQPNYEMLIQAAPLLFYVVNNADTIFINTGAEAILRGDLQGVKKDAFASRDPIYLCMEFHFNGQKFVINKTCAQPFEPEMKYTDPPSINISRYLSDSSEDN